MRVVKLVIIKRYYSQAAGVKPEEKVCPLSKGFQSLSKPCKSCKSG